MTSTNVQTNIFSPAYLIQKTLSVTDIQQDNWYDCQAACAQMISGYYGVIYSQTYIFNIMGGNTNGATDDQALIYYKASNGLNKPNSWDTTSCPYSLAVTEINYNRPYVSGISGHVRVGRGYKYDSSSQYLYINDPKLTTLYPYWEAYGAETHRIYVWS